MSSIRIRTAAGLVLGACVIHGLPAIAANSGDAGGSGSAASTQAADFTDKQLKQFVKAQSNVQSTLEKWNDKIAKADDRKSARKQENKAMVKAVTVSGLTPAQYNRIARKAQKDRKLTKRIQSFMTPQ